MGQREPFVNMYGEYPCDMCGELFVPQAEIGGRALDTVCVHCVVEEEQIAEHLREFVELVVEKKVREVQVSDGSRVPQGSLKHIKDLETRIAGLEHWRDQQRRGSEVRANYSRLISRLKAELASARRVGSASKGIYENYATEADPEQVAKWEKLERGETPDSYVKQLIDSFHNATTMEALDDVRAGAQRRVDSGKVSSAVSTKFLSWIYAKCAAKLGVMVKKLK